MKSSGSIALLSLLILAMVLAMVLVLPSCRDEDFRVTGAQLKGVSSYRLCEDGSLDMTGEYLVLSMTIPADDSYAFHLEDADGLVWEGDLSGDDGVYSSDGLIVSSTASLLEGEYLYRVINDEGEVESGSLDYHREDLVLEFGQLSATHDLVEVADGWSTRDSNGNTILISYARP